MPIVDFTLRWPDGTRQACESPSRAIGEHLAPGGVYPLEELVRRVRDGLHEASRRLVTARGFACTGTVGQLAAVEARAAGFAAGALVRCEAVQPRWPRTPGLEPSPLRGHHEAVVIGGGQAGLAASRSLRERGIEHVVLTRDVVGAAWLDERWDAFCLVTPNWQCQLPGFPYDGPEPDGFMGRDAIVGYMRRYVEAVRPPVHERVAVTRLAPRETAGFVLETTAGELSADQVVLAVGGYHRPAVPAAAERLPAPVASVHSSAYRNPSSLADGAVLVVGSGQSGAQIAEDLRLAGRETHLAVGGAPRVARAHRGRDVVAWQQDLGRYDLPITEHPEGLGARKEVNHYVTGRDGGHDLDLRAMARDGLVLHGRLADVRDGRAHFAADLRDNLDAADDTYRRINATIDDWIAARGVAAPPAPTPYAPVWTPPGDGSEPLDLDGVGTVVWATGFVSDWSWVQLPAFDGNRYPTHVRGVTTVDGLHVLGLPWLHTWGSGRFAGIARDAAHVADAVAARRAPIARAA